MIRSNRPISALSFALAALTWSCTLPANSHVATISQLSGGSLLSSDGAAVISNHGGSVVTNNGGNLISNNAGGLVSNNAGSLTGVITGPGAGLIANNAAGLVSNNVAGLVSNNAGGLVSNNAGGLVSNNAAGLVSNNAGGFRLLDTTTAATAVVSGAVVTVVDARGTPISLASSTTDAKGSYTIQALGPSQATVFVRATFLQEGHQITLLGAAPAPRANALIEASVDPALSLVSKKAAAAAAAGTLPEGSLDAATLSAMASQMRPLMTGKALVAAGLDVTGLGARAFDAMLQQSPTLTSVVLATAGQTGLGKIVTAPFMDVAATASAAPGTAVTPGPLKLVAGGSAQGFQDGVGGAALLNQPYALAADTGGSLYVSDYGDSRIRKIAADATVTTLAGTGVAGFADGYGAAASFSGPRELAVDSAGNVYVADAGNQRIRKISPSGLVTTLAGTGEAGFADGPAASARFNSPRGLAVDAAGDVFVADTQNFRIRKIDAQGDVTTVAGNGTSGYADGAGAAAEFAGPLALAIDGAHNLYVSDYYGHRIRKIGATGSVSTLAGDGKAGSADGARAEFNFPAGLALDAAGTVYVADFGNNAIRAIAPNGTVSTLKAGTPTPFSGPYGLTVAPSGTLYIADTSNQRVCELAH